MARRYKQGFFQPLNPKKYAGDPSQIVFRSGWELKFMNWCDRNPSVLKWASEELVIPYWSRADGKERRYFVDFIVQQETKDGGVETLLVEIKPDSQTKVPKNRKGKKVGILTEETYTYMVNQDKWEAASEYARKRGMRFVVLTEYELGIKKRR